MFNFLRKLKRNERVIHLDYASTTPVAGEVLRTMLPYWSEEWANPNAIYRSGVRAREVIEAARTRIARMLRVRREGVIFTSGGTESNNHALVGLIEKLRAEGRAYEDMSVITTRIEHPSILGVCSFLKAKGVEIQYAMAEDDGRITVEHLATLLSPRTVLVTFAYVNSEIGVVQDVKRITRVVRAYNASEKTRILVHLDAAQAPLWLPCEMDMLGVDLLSLDSGKCFGPKGAGVLAFRHGVALAPLMHGGGQEGGLRSGTENTALIVGCTEALVRAQAEWMSRSEAVTSLRDVMLDLLIREIPGAVINGSREHRVANNVNISIPGIDTEFAVITLDKRCIAASTKSACGTADSQGSYVVRALTNDALRAASTIRFTLGPETTKREIFRAVEVLKEHIEKMRSFTESLSNEKV